MMRVFVDTNVLLDVLLEREPFYTDSARIWTLAEQGRIQGFVSVLSFANVFYVVRKTGGRAAAREALRVIRDSFTPVACDEQIIHQAIDSPGQDFEDALQFFSASRAGADCIVTRDSGHFRQAGLSVLSPAEFLAEARRRQGESNQGE